MLKNGELNNHRCASFEVFAAVWLMFSFLPGYDAVSVGNRIPMFLGNLPSCSMVNYVQEE